MFTQSSHQLFRCFWSLLLTVFAVIYVRPGISRAVRKTQYSLTACETFCLPPSTECKGSEHSYLVQRQGQCTPGFRQCISWGN